ncbi:hypothetical protein NA57DRAFT_52309 [Rhizodiscina lignyota]|uniref:Uncharacterized protein n=1 Tax=Rhizodiscina lignyota TaxID=1504668 RepID=A0A9P4IJH7_9PEZI|nr:hypothetical protein NA57DRAFT_52309 [Rhizodiscina lignyota]
MQFSTIFLTSLLAAGSTFAAPTASSAAPAASSSAAATTSSAPAAGSSAAFDPSVDLVEDVAKGAQSCKATDFITDVTYKIHIGEPFKKSHCHSLSGKIGKTLGSGLQECKPTKKHHMFVQFTATHDQAKKINKIFDNEFPEVNGFNCPNF